MRARPVPAAATLRNLIALLVLGLPLVGAACAGGADAPSTPGVVGDTIFVGVITPLSDAVAVIGRPVAVGIQAALRQANERGGLGGRYMVKAIEEDITYANPSTGVQKYQKIKGDVAMFATVLGTDQVNGVVPLLGEDSLIVVPTTFDMAWVRQPNLVPWGPPYQVWVVNAAAYYLENGGAGKRLCSMVLATGYGEAAEEGLEVASEALGFEIAAQTRFRQDDQDFVAPITQLRNAQCDAVFLASLPGVTGRVLGAAAQLGYEPQWIAQSPAWAAALAGTPLRDYYARHLWLIVPGPEWGDMSVPGMADMLDAFAKYAPDQQPDIYALFGYVLGRTTLGVLEQAVAQGDLSRTGLLHALETLETIDYGGLSPTYRYGPAEAREAPRAVSIFRIDPDGPWATRAIVTAYSSPAAQQFRF